MARPTGVSDKNVKLLQQIKTLKNSGFGQREIARKLGVPPGRVLGLVYRSNRT